MQLSRKSRTREVGELFAWDELILEDFVVNCMSFILYEWFYGIFTLAFLSFLPAILIDGKVSYSICCVLFLISLSYSLKKPDKRIGIKMILSSLISKYKNSE